MKHPITITGTVVFAGSWLFLLFGTGADEYRSIINLHKLAIAHAGILSGIGLLVLGHLSVAKDSALKNANHGLAETIPTDNTSVDNGPRMTAEELAKAIEEAKAKLAK